MKSALNQHFVLYAVGKNHLTLKSRWTFKWDNENKNSDLLGLNTITFLKDKADEVLFKTLSKSLKCEILSKDFKILDQSLLSLHS